MFLSYLLTFLLFLLPFIVLPFGISYFETPKIIFGEIGMILFISIRLLKKPQIKPFLKHLLPLMLFSGIFLLSLLDIFAKYSSLTLFGNQFRHQGTFLLWLLLLFSIFSSQIKILKVPKWMFTILLALELLASIFFVSTIDARAVGTLGEPNALASFAIFLWPFAILREKISSKKNNQTMQNSNNRRSPDSLQKILPTIFTLIIILISGSRSGLIAFAIEALFLTLYQIFHVSLPKTTILCIFLFLMSLFLPLFQTNIYENRSEIWKAGLIAGYEQPLTGWGFGNTEIAFKTYDKKLFNNQRGYYIDSSHNIFLDWWIQGGFIGLALFISMLYASFRFAVKNKQSHILVPFLGLLTMLSFNPASIVTLISFFWLLSQSLFHTKQENTISRISTLSSDAL